MRILRRAELRQCAAKGGKFQPPLRLKRVPVGGGEQGLKLPAPKPGDGPGRGFAAGLPDPPADRLDDRVVLLCQGAVKIEKQGLDQLVSPFLFTFLQSSRCHGILQAR